MNITSRDVVRLANTVSVKVDLNIHISSISQCSSDFILALYLAIMGELPSGVAAECTSVNAREHNIACIIRTLSEEYLHVDLSHICPSEFVAGEVATIYNLLEIFDGVLDFMLEQIDSELDSGDEGDDELSCRNQAGFAQVSDISSCTADLIKLDLSPHNLPTRDLSPLDLPTRDLSPHDPSSDVARLPVRDREERHDLPSTISRSNDKSDWIELQPSHDVTLPDCDITEHTLNSTDCRSLRTGLEGYDSPPRPMLIESLSPDVADGGRVLADLTRSLRSTKPEPSVELDASIRGSGISVSDVTSESSKASASSSVILDTAKPMLMETWSRNALPLGGVDVADGIPKPELGVPDSPQPPHAADAVRGTAAASEGDWEGLLNNLQKTVEESKRIREKFFSSPATERREQSDGARDSTLNTSDASPDHPFTRHKRRNVRFEDSPPPSDGFEQTLRKERELQAIKNQVLRDNFRDHLEEVEDVERRKMAPLVLEANRTATKFKGAVARQPVKKSRSSARKSLAEAAKWKSWQSPTVIHNPRRRLGRVRVRPDPGMALGEHDLLPTLLAEFPGMQLPPASLNDAWTKQFRQIERLTRAQDDHAAKKKRSEKQLQEAHHRHQLLIDIMRREHEHNERVRGAREQAFSEMDASRRSRERRQQSARVRRYYRDYQLQMRSRMLRRRTREERLFKNLFQEGLNIQKSRLNDLRRYARDKREEQLRRQRNEIASLENFYSDQFAMLADTLRGEKEELKTREKAQTQLLRQMKGGLRRKMEQEVRKLQEQISRDDDDIYFRELEADRIRRQLQLATYNAKYDATVAK